MQNKKGVLATLRAFNLPFMLVFFLVVDLICYALFGVAILNGAVFTGIANTIGLSIEQAIRSDLVFKAKDYFSHITLPCLLESLVFCLIHLFFYISKRPSLLSRSKWNSGADVGYLYPVHTCLKVLLNVHATAMFFGVLEYSRESDWENPIQTTENFGNQTRNVVSYDVTKTFLPSDWSSDIDSSIKNCLVGMIVIYFLICLVDYLLFLPTERTIMQKLRQKSQSTKNLHRFSTALSLLILVFSVFWLFVSRNSTNSNTWHGMQYSAIAKFITPVVIVFNSLLEQAEQEMSHTLGDEFKPTSVNLYKINALTMIAVMCVTLGCLGEFGSAVCIVLLTCFASFVCLDSNKLSISSCLVSLALGVVLALMLLLLETKLLGMLHDYLFQFDDKLTINTIFVVCLIVLAIVFFVVFIMSLLNCFKLAAQVETRVDSGRIVTIIVSFIGSFACCAMLANLCSSKENSDGWKLVSFFLSKSLTANEFGYTGFVYSVLAWVSALLLLITAISCVYGLIADTNVISWTFHKIFWIISFLARKLQQLATLIKVFIIDRTRIRIPVRPPRNKREDSRRAQGFQTQIWSSLTILSFLVIFAGFNLVFPTEGHNGLPILQDYYMLTGSFSTEMDITTDVTSVREDEAYQIHKNQLKAEATANNSEESQETTQSINNSSKVEYSVDEIADALRGDDESTSSSDEKIATVSESESYVLTKNDISYKYYVYYSKVGSKMMEIIDRLCYSDNTAELKHIQSGLKTRVGFKVNPNYVTYFSSLQTKDYVLLKDILDNPNYVVDGALRDCFTLGGQTSNSDGVSYYNEDGTLKDVATLNSLSSVIYIYDVGLTSDEWNATTEDGEVLTVEMPQIEESRVFQKAIPETACSDYVLYTLSKLGVGNEVLLIIAPFFVMLLCVMLGYESVNVNNVSTLRDGYQIFMHRLAILYMISFVTQVCVIILGVFGLSLFSGLSMPFVAKGNFEMLVNGFCMSVVFFSVGESARTRESEGK